MSVDVLITDDGVYDVTKQTETTPPPKPSAAEVAVEDFGLPPEEPSKEDLAAIRRGAE